MNELLQELDRIEKRLNAAFADLRKLAQSDMFTELSPYEQNILFFNRLKRAFTDLDAEQEGK